MRERLYKTYEMSKPEITRECLTVTPLADTCFSSPDSFPSTFTTSEGNTMFLEQTEKKVPLADSLITWSNQFNISQSALSGLLHILKPYNLKLPLDARTLLQTPRVLNVRTCSGGSFMYFGIENQILEKLNGHSLSDNFFPVIRKKYPGAHNLLTLSVNVDGLPVENSSNLSFWPILGILDQSTNKTPFIIALYEGKSKPKDANSFLDQFTNECLKLEREGIIFNDIKYEFHISCFIADAPARAFLKCIKSHNAKRM